MVAVPHNGADFASSCTTFYKVKDTDSTDDNVHIFVTFGEIGECERMIQVIRHSVGKNNGLIYTFEDSFYEISKAKINPTLNNDILLIDNFETKRSECNSIEKLSKLENQLKENIEDFQAKLSTDIDLVGVYKLKGNRQFKTFEEAFETVLEEL